MCGPAYYPDAETLLGILSLEPNCQALVVVGQLVSLRHQTQPSGRLHSLPAAPPGLSLLPQGVQAEAERLHLQEDKPGPHHVTSATREASPHVEEFLPKMGSPQPLFFFSFLLQSISLVRAIARGECKYSQTWSVLFCPVLALKPDET